MITDQGQTPKKPSILEEAFQTLEKEHAAITGLIDKLVQQLEPVRVISEDPERAVSTAEVGQYSNVIRRLQQIAGNISAQRIRLESLSEELQL